MRQINFDNYVNIRQTPGFAKFLEFFHWKMLSPRENTFYYIRHLSFFGSIIKIEKINVKNINLKEIDEIARNEKAMFVKIEPFADDSQQAALDKLFFSYGYTYDTWPLSSTATYLIDLSKSYEQIINNFKSKFRYNLRLAESKNNLKVKIINGKQLIGNQKLLNQFAEIYNNRAKEIKSEQHSYKELLHMCESYGDKLWMLYIENLISNSKFQISKHMLVMASFFLQTKDILHYWHNGSTLEGRKLFAPTLIIAEGIKLWQKLGCKIFDFEGIYDERFVEQTKRWKGFTKFKEGFNGEKVVFAKPYIKYYSPVLTVFHFFRMI